MDNLDFTEGMKILSSCYHKDISNDDLIIWYEMLKDVEPEVYRKAIIDLCKERSYMPTIHDILDKTKTTKNNYYLSILEQMKKDGYFKLGVEPLSSEQEERNYDKSIRWIERGIIPGFLLEDMQKYINKSSNKLIGNDKKYLE